MSNNTRNYILTYNQLLKECDTIYHTAAVNSGLSDCAFWILYTVQDTEHIYTQSEICDNSSLPRQTVNSALKKLEKDAKKYLLRIVPERIHTMIPGLMILEGVIECFGCKRIEISRYGVREGYLFENVLRREKDT